MSRVRTTFGFRSCVALVAASLLVSSSCLTTGRRREAREQRLDRGSERPRSPHPERSYPVLRVELPTVAGAEYVNNDQLCGVCHSTYVEAFNHNVHRKESCEACHGPASRHLETRGQEPGLIRSFPKLKKAERSEVCAQCHDQNGCAPGSEWRTSAHAHRGVTCIDCHVDTHYNVPAGSPPVVPDYAQQKQLDEFVRLVSLRTTRGPGDDGKTLKKPEGSERLPSLRGTSNFLGAVAPLVCYKCHGEKYDLEAVAHPHQVSGPHSFSCETCHNPHGNVVPMARKELCLQCHKTTPLQAWHSSVHNHVGVACTDCHDPHPHSRIRQAVDIEHTSIRRENRLPMSVDDPNVCYKCHQDMFAMTQLPSHHPIREGKMTCSACHDPHGQGADHLQEETVNLTCYKCHADKQGPFVYHHAPVEEDCSICHNPHGSVTNNLLHQPTTFLCLRCHTGHRADPTEHFGMGTSDIDNLDWVREVLYTDCTQCHTQVHGSDLPSAQRTNALMR